MEEIFNFIKEFILETVNGYISEAADETTRMNEIKEKDIVFGAVDLSRYSSANVVCAVVPENQEDDESEVGAYKIGSEFTVSFFCKGYPQDELVRQMCRYGEAFRRAVLDDVSLGQRVESAEIGRRNFFTDAGAVGKQLTAVEIELTVMTEDDIEI
ncbi:MAG: hypothetical protein IJ727_08265 [Treponema sp.]|nr:hypothetical protein [Treponema sp.]